MADGLQSPYHNASAPTPSGSESGGGLSGGYDFPDGRKESANMSGLPASPVTVHLSEDDPGVGASVGVPPVDTMHTIPSKGYGAD